jgi:hypothetical protein
MENIMALEHPHLLLALTELRQQDLLSTAARERAIQVANTRRHTAPAERPGGRVLPMLVGLRKFGRAA